MKSMLYSSFGLAALGILFAVAPGRSDAPAPRCCPAAPAPRSCAAVPAPRCGPAIAVAPAVAAADAPAAPAPAQLVESLARAYRERDPDLYATLFAESGCHGVEFRFVLYEPTPEGETEWGYAEEIRIHRRMFRPDALPAGERPVPPELWVKSIAIELEPLTAWRERFDLYRSEHNPSGPIDRHRWRASAAVYATSVQWTTAGRGVFSIAGQARFVVLEDRTLLQGTPGQCVFYIWEDLGPGDVARSDSNG